MIVASPKRILSLSLYFFLTPKNYLLPNQPQAEISRRGFKGVKENLEPIYYRPGAFLFQAAAATADVDDKKAIRH